MWTIIEYLIHHLGNPKHDLGLSQPDMVCYVDSVGKPYQEIEFCEDMSKHVFTHLVLLFFTH
jgi:hypothetical protein